jgi:hypothetical protein
MKVIDVDKLKLGEEVLSSFKYVRQSSGSSNPQATILKFWITKVFPNGNPRKGVFLGIRWLQNGVREFDSEQGYVFSPEKYVKAALVCFHKRENPVYVPDWALWKEG